MSSFVTKVQGYFVWVLSSWWRRQWHPTPVLLPGKSHGRKSLVGYSPWGREESDITERSHFHFSFSCIGEGDGNPLQCSCLENPRDSGTWWAVVYGVAQSWTWLKRLSSSSMANNVVIVSGEQWTVNMDTYTYIHSLPNSPPIQAATLHWAAFQCYTVGLYWLSFLNIAVCVSRPQTP